MSDPSYSDEDLVYVDPDRRMVVGRVEFGKNGNAKPLLMPETESPASREGRPARKPRKRYYPWGTYRSMRKLYKIDGGVLEADRRIALEDAMDRCSKEAFWN
jgi:hypothetical protein